jgi:hypothetical protein
MPHIRRNGIVTRTWTTARTESDDGKGGVVGDDGDGVAGATDRPVRGL